MTTYEIFLFAGWVITWVLYIVMYNKYLHLKNKKGE